MQSKCPFIYINTGLDYQRFLLLHNYVLDEQMGRGDVKRVDADLATTTIVGDEQPDDEVIRHV